jgi:hypothetical protein
MSSDQTGRGPSLPNQLSHQEVRDRLHAYAFATLIEDAPEARYPAVAAHLARCTACRAVLDELIEMTRAAAVGEGEPVSLDSAPNLSRLPRPWMQTTSRSPPWLTDKLGRLWLEFSEALLRSWQPSAVLGTPRGALLYEYRYESETLEPSLTIEIFAEEDPEMTLLCITIDMPHRDVRDQMGIPITLQGAGVLEQAETDRSGTARFPHIARAALARLRLEITVGQSA